MEENKKSTTIAYREAIAYDESGGVVFDALYKPHSQNGSGWMITYTNTNEELLKKVTSPSILRIFFYFSIRQSYDIENGGGFKCTRRYLQETLHLTKKTVISSLKWLEENFLIKEAIINGQSDFLVNPDFATIGKNKKDRVNEWNRRCGEYVKKLEANQAQKQEAVPSGDA